jgi:uncharacterized membrane protein
VVPIEAPPEPEEEAMNASDKVQSIDVNVPVRVAYDQWTQFEEFPRFMSGVESVTQLSDTRLRWKVDVAGVVREFETAIVEQTPDQRIAWTTTEGPRHAGVVTFHKIDDTTTRIMVQMDFEPTGFLENVGDKVGFVSARIRGDMGNFKEFIEARGVETGAWRGEVGRD